MWFWSWVIDPTPKKAMGFHAQKGPLSFMMWHCMPHVKLWTRSNWGQPTMDSQHLFSNLWTPLVDSSMKHLARNHYQKSCKATFLTNLNLWIQFRTREVEALGWWEVCKFAPGGFIVYGHLDELTLWSTISDIYSEHLWTFNS